MPGQLTQSIKPSGQGGDYTSITSWEAQNLDLVSLDSSSYVEVSGDWTGLGPDGRFDLAGWITDATHQIYAKVTGEARHNGYYDPNKYVNTNLTYGNPININADFATVDGFQAKLTGSNVAYYEGIQLIGSLNNCENIIKNCIVIDMHSGSGAAGNAGIQFGFFTGNKKTGSLYNNIIIGFNRTHGNDSLVHTGIGNYGWPNRIVNNTMIDCYRPFYQNTGRTWIYNTIITGSEAVSYGTLTGSHNLSNVDTFGKNQVYGRVQFVNPSNYDYRLSPYDTAVMSKGLNLYTSSFGVSITDDISGISRGNIFASNFDIGASHSTKSIKTIKPSGQGGDYTSVSSWESAEQKNLISINKSYIAEIGGDWSSTNDSGFGIFGWVTGPNNYIKVTTTGTARHNGVWDTSKYWINGGTGASAAYQQNYVTVDGIQGYQTGSGNYFVGVVHFTAGAADAISILENSILKVDSYSKIGSWTACIKGQFANTGSYVVRNCIFTVGDSAYNSVSASRVYCLYSYPKTTFYNCLAIRSKGYGFYEGGAYNMTYYNCIAQDTINGYVGGITAQSDYNCSDLASDAPGANSVTADLTFQDTSSGNYRLTSADSAVIGTGLDLLSLGYDYAPTTDIVGVTRTSGSWDMGPFAFVSGPTPVPTVYVSARRMAGFFFP